MDRPSPVDRLSQQTQVALLLSQVALAGCVDAIGWLMLGGLFVSFMSGNSTQLAVALADGQWLWLARVGGVLAAFFAGVLAGALMREGSRGGSHATLFALAAAVLALVLTLVQLYGVTTLHVLPLAFAMGLLNNARRMVGGAAVGGTFVTGAFVGAAHGLASWMTGRSGGGAFALHALSWLALATGAIVGALLALRGGQMAALLVPVLWAAVLAVAHWRVARGA